MIIDNKSKKKGDEMAFKANIIDHGDQVSNEIDKKKILLNVFLLFLKKLAML